MLNKLLEMTNVSRETLERLENYQALLLKWNRKINLISKDSEQYCWERHILDAVQLLLYIKNLDICLIDAGSGAGIPGIILSICGVKNTKIIESNSKKVAFLNEATKFSEFKIEIYNDRIENLSLECDIFTARGLSSLDNIFYLSKNMTIYDKFLLLKGKTYQDEILEAKQNWTFNCSAYSSLTNKDSKILEINSLISIK